MLVEDNVGKDPTSDEMVTYVVEKDKRSGRVYDVQVTRCRICGQITSWVRFKGEKLLGGYVHTGHNCNKNLRVEKPGLKGAGEGVTFNLMDWLSKWQRRLSRMARQR